MNIKEAIQKKRLYFDGGYGTVLQSMGLGAGEAPEAWSLSHPDRITALHREYLRAGCNILTTNTFGVNPQKYENYEEYIAAAIACAKRAAEGTDAYIAFDMGPTGKMLEPLGDLLFEDAVSLFSANVKAAARCGVDLILIETMNDAYETKAAVLAAKESCDLPIFVTNVYDESGKLMTGADPEAMIALLEGLGVDALGMNCSFGPDVMLGLLPRFTARASVPLIVNPNAGLPRVENGKTVYDISPDEFGTYMRKIAACGASVLGGCCGTTPEHIVSAVAATRDLPYTPPQKKDLTVLSSYTHAVTVDRKPILIGERINPTGKAKLKEALRAGDLNYILNEGIRQEEKGADVLDVNVGLPEIDEKETMRRAVQELQAVTDLPLQLDSSNPSVLEASMRIYNGKPLVNSVNGSEQSMSAVLPLVKHYGGTVIALTMDENGIPETAEGRVEIARRIARRAAALGVEKKDIIVDPLCLTISSHANSATVTLDAISLLTAEGFKTSLGVSNVSFGLPERDKINAAFFAAALERGLNCAIMNPFSVAMTDVYYAFCALHGMDEACAAYIGYATANATKTALQTETLSLKECVAKGLRDAVIPATDALLETLSPLDIIDHHLIPALSEVGVAFEEKKIYLPQLLMSAEAASTAFDRLKTRLPSESVDRDRSVILATVKGDIHDIGKNIVRLLLESYGFHVYDLGRDVAPETVLEWVAKTGCRLVSLSALMTTTVPAMAETVALLHKAYPDVRVMVGGAVLNQEYADMIHADHYCPDAMEAVRYASSCYSK